jgi:leucyl aminopeptidase
MYNMKDDMAWSSTLLFTMKELDEKNLNCNIITALPIAENSISWDSYRPWDIIKSYSWKTVEIVNTDAEWRLILADAISYISKNYELESITTVATLTWACIYALWYNYAWIMWNNRQMIDSLLKNNTFEAYWELPYNEFYIEKTKWNISDLKNLTEWVFAWSTMWWAFLSNFCLKKELFTHIDIAWVAFVKEKYWLYNVWATWFWVDSLSKVILEYWKNNYR